jgi:hypothetical protein
MTLTAFRCSKNLRGHILSFARVDAREIQLRNRRQSTGVLSAMPRFDTSHRLDFFQEISTKDRGKLIL